MNRCPASPHCPYCDDDTSEYERSVEAANFEALAEAHMRPCEPDDLPDPSSIVEGN